MVVFPQHGGCLCGDVRYSVTEDPVTLYVCHCTDCQRQSGTSFALSMIVRKEAVKLVRGRPQDTSIELEDGRVKRPTYCARCSVRVWARSSVPGLTVVEPGTLDDTSWLRPVGHIWTRSAQPWVHIPEDAITFEQQARGEAGLALVRAWKERSR